MPEASPQPSERHPKEPPLPNAGQPHVQQEHLSALGSSSPESDQARLDYKTEAIKSLNSLAHDVIRDLWNKEKVPFSWSATLLDLHYAALSSYCEGNYVFSLPPSGRTPLGYLVKRDSDVVLFTHVMQAMARQPRYTREMFDEVGRTGMISISESTYSEYVEMHQGIARTFAHKPDDYQERMAKLVGLGLIGLFSGGSQAHGIMPQHLAVASSGNDLIGITLRNVGTHRKYVVPVNEGECVFLPWAPIGLGADFHHLASFKENRFIISAENRFAHQVFELAAAQAGCFHIANSSTPAEQITLPEKSVGLMLISHPERHSAEEVEALARNARQFMSSSGEVFLYAHQHNLEPGRIDVREIGAMFLRNGFRISESVSGICHRAVSALGKTGKSYLDMNASEILGVLAAQDLRALEPGAMLRLS